MEAHIFFLSSILTISFFLTTLPKSLCQQDQYLACQHSFHCGSLEDLYYPFWSGNLQPPYCRSYGFELNCQEGQFLSILMGSQNFSVLNIDPPHDTMTIKRAETFTYDDCFSDFTNTSLNTQHNLFRYRSNVKNVTLFYDCPSEVSIGRNNFTCKTQTSEFVYYAEDDDPLSKSPEFNKCGRRINVPISNTSTLGLDYGLEDLKRALGLGFDVIYAADGGARCIKCENSGGNCSSNGTDDYSLFICQCRDGPHPTDCLDSKKWHWKVIVGAAAVLISVIVMSIAFFFHRRRQKNSYAKSYIQSRATSSDSSLMDPEKGSKYFGVHLFTYTELEEATNYFDSTKELGDGGFGTVYFGKLRDGRCVAVKRLYENNYKRVEQFMNEVEILTRLRHQNLVSLYGCTSRHSRELLLVYEYISNGTVADHLHGERAEPGSLPWHIRIKIAIETASALAYLHASDIIHRDVKTNNILLDDHFCVKVADFGLSRLFPNDVTHISTAPQGTPGYVDPEYHECYQLTDKSDVYSFGVVLIELISSMPAVDITRHRHEINLSTMAINKIQNRALHELVGPTLGFESDYKVRKMINAVAELAFQCLQSLKDMRPSMEEVLDTLRDIESDGQHKSKPEVMDISADDVVLLKNDLPPSPDSNLASKSTTPNDSK